jgi:hypothetical protein
MNNSVGQYSLDDVLDAYSEASEEPSRKILAEWIASYPQYERELIEFTVAWILSEELPEIPDDQQDINARIQSGLRVTQKIFEKRSTDDQEENSHSPPKLVSLIVEGSILGLSVDQLAQQVNLSVTLMRKLENRLFIVDTIPTDLVRMIGMILQRAPADITTYLNQEQMLPSGFRMKSRQPPKMGGKQNFFDAVRDDPELGVEQRAYWLSFET